MDETKGFLMQPGCPWVPLREWSGLPNVRWCEEQLCAWITTPANTWSNLAYIVVALAFFWMARKNRAENIRFFGTAALWVGWTSFVWHATLSFATQILDFVGMYIFCYLLLVQNLARCGWVAPSRVRVFTWGLTFVTTVLSTFVDKLGFPVQGTIVVLVGLIIATEGVARQKASRKYSLSFMFVSLACLAVAVVFSVSDVTGRFCDPTNHWIQGHALWHVFSSISLFFSIFFYRQFYSPETGRLET
jgi:hypothetical protein